MTQLDRRAELAGIAARDVAALLESWGRLPPGGPCACCGAEGVATRGVVVEALVGGLPVLLAIDACWCCVCDGAALGRAVRSRLDALRGRREGGRRGGGGIRSEEEGIFPGDKTKT